MLGLTRGRSRVLELSRNIGEGDTEERGNSAGSIGVWMSSNSVVSLGT